MKKVSRHRQKIRTLVSKIKTLEFLAIREINQEYGWPIYQLCQIRQVSKSGYYKWLNKQPTVKELGTQYNQKRICRIMRKLDLYSVIRRPKSTYIRANATHISENILHRQFDSATAPNQIWCTDVTEFKCNN